jgi:hypothetical protein
LPSQHSIVGSASGFALVRSALQKEGIPPKMIFPEVETDASGERQSAKDVPEAADHDCRAVWRRPSSIVSHGREHAPRRKKLAQGSHS